jgi:hypothetical protein
VVLIFTEEENQRRISRKILHIQEMSKKKTLQNTTLQSQSKQFFHKFEISDKHVYLLLLIPTIIFFREIIFRTSFFWEDFVVQYYPFRSFFATSIADGTFPLWNPYTFAGMPFQADIQTALFYLPNWLLVPFVSAGKLDIWYMELLNILHYYLAGITMYYCARSFSLSRVSAAFCAISYVFSGFAIVHAIHPVFISHLALFPLAFLLYRKSIVQHSWLIVILCSFILSQMLLSGSPQLSFYAFFFLFLYSLYEVFTRHQENRDSETTKKAFFFRATYIFIIIVFLSLGFSAIQLLPTLELSSLSSRAEIAYGKTLEGQLSWQQIFTLIVPKFFGTFNHLDTNNREPYWGSGSYNTYWETCIYVGIVTLTLALSYLSFPQKKRYTMFFSGVSLFSLLYSLGDNFILHKFFYEFIPGFDKFRSVGRFNFLFVVSMSLLSGFSFQQMLNAKEEKEKKKFLWISSALLATVLFISFIVRTSIFDNFILWQVQQNVELKDVPYEYSLPIISAIAQKYTLNSLFIISASLILFFFYSKKKLSYSVVVFSVFLFLFIDIYLYGFEQNNSKENPETYFSARKEFVTQIQSEQKQEFFRVASRDKNHFFLDRNQGMLEKIFLLEGYTPLSLKRIIPPTNSSSLSRQLLNTKYALKFSDNTAPKESNGVWQLESDSSFLPRVSFVYNYRTFFTPDKESLFMLSPQFNPREMVALEEEPNISLDTIPTNDWTAEIQSYKNNSFTVKVSTPKTGMLLLSEIFYPGWNAYVDGKQTKVYRADWSLRALVVEKGEHVVEMKFEPTPYYSGMKISLATLFLCVAIGGFDFYRRRKSSEQIRNPKSEITNSQ